MLLNQVPSGPPYYVTLIVNDGESVTVPWNNGKMHVFKGPVRITLVSNKMCPPMPFPIKKRGQVIEQLIDETGIMKEVHVWSDSQSLSSPRSLDASPGSSTQSSSCSERSYSPPPRHPVCVPSTHLFDQSHLLCPTEHEYECCYCCYEFETPSNDFQSNFDNNSLTMHSELPVAWLTTSNHMPSLFPPPQPNTALYSTNLPSTLSSSSSSSATSSASLLMPQNSLSTVNIQTDSSNTLKTSASSSASSSSSSVSTSTLTAIDANSSSSSSSSTAAPFTSTSVSHSLPSSESTYTKSILCNTTEQQASHFAPDTANECTECAQYFQNHFSTYTGSSSCSNQCLQCDSSQYCTQCDEAPPTTLSTTSINRDLDVEKSYKDHSKTIYSAPLFFNQFQTNQSNQSTKSITELVKQSSFNNHSLPLPSSSNSSSSPVSSSSSSLQHLHHQKQPSSSSAIAPFWIQHNSDALPKPFANLLLNRRPTKLIAGDHYDAPSDFYRESIHTTSTNRNHNMNDRSSNDQQRKNNSMRSTTAVRPYKVDRQEVNNNNSNNNNNNINCSLNREHAIVRSFSPKHSKSFQRNVRNTLVNDGNGSPSKSTASSSLASHNLVRKMNKSNLALDRKLSLVSERSDELIEKKVEPLLPDSEATAHHNRLNEDEPDDGYEDDDLDRKSSISPASFVQQSSQTINVNACLNKTNQSSLSTLKVKMIRAEDLEAEAHRSFALDANQSKECTSSVVRQVGGNKHSVSNLSDPAVKSNNRPTTSKSTKTSLTKTSVTKKADQTQTGKEKKSLKSKSNQQQANSNVKIDNSTNESKLIDCKLTNEQIDGSNKSISCSNDEKTTKSDRSIDDNDESLNDADKPDRRTLSSERPLRMSSLPVKTALQLTCVHAVAGRVRLRWSWSDDNRPAQKTDFLVEISSERNNRWRIAHRCSTQQCRLNNLPSDLCFRFRVRTVVSDQQLVSNTLIVQIPDSVSNSSLPIANEINATIDCIDTNKNEKSISIHLNDWPTSKLIATESISTINKQKIIMNNRIWLRFQSSIFRLRSLINRLLSEQFFAFGFLFLFAIISCAIAFSFQNFLLI